MVAQLYDLRLKTLEIRVRTLPWVSSGHVTTRSMSPQHLRSQMPTLATKNFGSRLAQMHKRTRRMQLPSFVSAVLIELSLWAVAALARAVAGTVTLWHKFYGPFKTAIGNLQLTSFKSSEALRYTVLNGTLKYRYFPSPALRGPRDGTSDVEPTKTLLVESIAFRLTLSSTFWIGKVRVDGL